MLWRELLEQYKTWCVPRDVTPDTIERYTYDIESFMRSLELHGEPLVLNRVCPFLVDQWILDMRRAASDSKRGPCPRVTISTRVVSLKVFSRKYIFENAGLTNRDLLPTGKVPIPKYPEAHQAQVYR